MGATPVQALFDTGLLPPGTRVAIGLTVRGGVARHVVRITPPPGARIDQDAMAVIAPLAVMAAVATRLAQMHPLEAAMDTRGVDRESAQAQPRIAAAQAAVAALIEQSDGPTPQRLSRGVAREIRQLLRTSRRSDNAAHREALRQRRGDMTVLERAFLALYGRSRPGDNASGIAENHEDDTFQLGDGTPVTPGVVAQLVWSRIKRVERSADNGAQRAELFRWGVVQALAECVDEDGTRVCPNGMVQRLINVVAGELGGETQSAPPAPPTPHDLVSYASLAHQTALEAAGESRPGESPEALRLRRAETLRTYVAAVTESANSVYPAGDERIQQTLPIAEEAAESFRSTWES